jgi:hypothetical protein
VLESFALVTAQHTDVTNAVAHHDDICKKLSASHTKVLQLLIVKFETEYVSVIVGNNPGEAVDAQTRKDLASRIVTLPVLMTIVDMAGSYIHPAN